MRGACVAILLGIAFAAQANVPGDTVYWHITYGKTAVLNGSLSAVQPARHELTVRPGSVKDLTVSFVYEAQPKASTLVIKEKNEVLRVIDQDPVMGPHFIVPVRELISTHQPDVRYELDFYYTVNGDAKEQKLATIVFIFK